MTGANNNRLAQEISLPFEVSNSEYNPAPFKKLMNLRFCWLIMECKDIVFPSCRPNSKSTVVFWNQ